MEFLLWRTLLTLQLGRLSFRALKHDSLLPILIFSSGFAVLLKGQLGQPTTLGFAAFVCGLCLAATRARVPDSPAMTDQPTTQPLPRRSVFASRLHGPQIGAENNNGFADR